MKLCVGFVGFSGIEGTIDGAEVDVDVAEGTLAALLSALEGRFGSVLLERLCHDGKTLDAGVMVLRNDVRVDGRNLSQRFSEGDRVAFVRMIAGG